VKFYQTYCQNQEWHVVDPDTGSMICGGPLETVYLPGIGNVIQAKPTMPSELVLKLSREIARAGPNEPPNIGKVILDYYQPRRGDGANTNDALTATLAVLSPTLAKTVQFIADKPGMRAHVDDITRLVDGITFAKGVRDHRNTVKTRYDRIKKKTDLMKTPLVIVKDDWVISLRDRS
jgi:hypothetical protein